MTYDVIIRNGLWFDGTGSAPAGPLHWAFATASSRRCPLHRSTRRAAPTSSMPQASGWSPASSTCTPTTTPRCCSIPACVSRCATASPPCCSATARCRPCTPTPRTPPTCSAVSRRCRASSCSVRSKPRRRGRRPAEYVADPRRSAARAECRLHARAFGPAHRGARPRPGHHRRGRADRTPNSTGWPRCSTRRSTRACSACPGWTPPSTNSTATASAPVRCRRRSRPGGNAAS